MLWMSRCFNIIVDFMYSKSDQLIALFLLLTKFRRQIHELHNKSEIYLFRYL